MYTEQDLIAHGYKKYTATWKGECCQYGYQKVVRDVEERSVKKYFINIYVWDFSRYSRMDQNSEIRFEPEVDFFYQNGISVTIKPHGFDNIGKLEQWLETFYNHNGFVPDLHNND